MIAKVLLVVSLFICAIAADVTVGSVLSAAPLSTFDSTHITIIGSGFTGATCVRIQGVECQNLAVISDAQVQCDAQPGLGLGNNVTVTTGSGSGVGIGIVDFAAPTVLGQCTDLGRDLALGAGATLTVCGLNFGDSAATTGDNQWTGTLKMYVQAGSAKLPVTILYHDNYQLMIQLPTTGSGKLFPIMVQIGSQTLPVPGITCTFPQPSVSDVQSTPLDKFKRDSNGQVRVDIFGSNFGQPGVMVTVTIGSYPCNINLNHVSDTEIRCTVAGFGANSGVVVVVNGFSSAEPNPVAQSAFGSAGGLNGVVSGSAKPTISTVRFDFPVSSQPGFECAPPNGAVDVNNADMCNCWSGYASASAFPGTDCALHTKCPAKTIPSGVAGIYTPNRPTTNFEKDTLSIKQTAPIVANRRDTILQIVAPNIPFRNPDIAPGTAGSSQCWYPGILWQKKLNDLDCVEEYYAEIPWSQNQYCGFVEDTDPQNIANQVKKYKASLVTTYTETYKNKNGVLSYRQMTNTYLMTVSFARQVVVLASADVNVYINDPTATGSLTVDILNDAFYDVASHEVIINFETTIVWPYQLDDISLPGIWTKAAGNTDTGRATAIATLEETSEAECNTVQDTDCSQTWMLKINGTACNLQGAIAFNTGTLLCRDLVDGSAVNCLFTSSTDFTITLGKTDLCDSAAHDVDATQGLTHVMDAFFDSEFQTPQNVFQTGDMVYFQVVLNDPLSSIDEITFNTISVANMNGDNDDLYAVQNPGDLPTDVHTTVLSAAQVNITSEIRAPHAIVSPGQDAIITFQFRLLRNHLTSLTNLGTNDFTQSLTLSAVVDIWYHGNQKRSVVVAGAIPSTAHAQISFYTMEDTETEMEAQESLKPTEEAQEGGDFSFFSAAPSTNYFGVFVAVVLSVVSAVLVVV